MANYNTVPWAPGDTRFYTDTNQNMTPAAYLAWQRQQALQQQQSEQDIHTNAQHGLQQQQIDANTAAHSFAADQAMKQLQAQFHGQSDLQNSAQSAAAALEAQHNAAAAAAQQAAFANAGQVQKNLFAHEDTAAHNLFQHQDTSAQAQYTHQDAYAKLQAQLQAEADARNQASIQGLMGNFSSSLGGSLTGGGGGGGMIGGGGGGQEDAARNAALAQAKDTAGQEGRGAMTALQNVMGARGLTGSGLAVNQAGGIINSGVQQQGQVNRDMLANNLQNARQRASEQYQGGLTMRGQNLNAVTSLANVFSRRAF